MLTDILEINQAALAETYDFIIENNTVGLIFGAAGIGKSEMAIQAVQKRNMSYYYVNLSVLEPIDMLGLPTTKDGKTSYASPEFLPWLTEDSGPPVTLLLDEIDKSKEDLQSPLLELLQFRSINGKKLNIQGIICTANLPDERAFSRKISHALTNRCSIFKVKHEFTPWRKWAVQTGLNPLIVSFLQSHQDFLLMKNDSGDPTAYCSPSPRSWALAARDLDQLNYNSFVENFKKEQEEEISEDILQQTINDKFINMQFKLIAGRVGVNAALKLKMWLVYYKELEPKIEEILETGQLKETLTSDQQIICATSLLYKLKEKFVFLDKNEKLKLADKAFGWMLDHMPPAYMLAAIKSTLNNDYVKRHGLLNSDNFNKMMDVIHETAH